MNRSKKLSGGNIEIKMTDFVVNMIKTTHLFENFENNDIFVNRNIGKHMAQICIKYDRPTHVELRAILSIELHRKYHDLQRDFELSLTLCSLEGLKLSKEQELEVLRGLNSIAEALEKELDDMTGDLISLSTNLEAVLKEAEDEQRKLLVRKGARH